MPSRRNDLARRIVRLLAEPTTQSVVLGGIPCANEPGGGWSDKEVIAAINDLLSRGRVMLVRTPKAERERS